MDSERDFQTTLCLSQTYFLRKRKKDKKLVIITPAARILFKNKA